MLVHPYACRCMGDLAAKCNYGGQTKYLFAPITKEYGDGGFSFMCPFLFCVEECVYEHTYVLKRDWVGLLWKGVSVSFSIFLMMSVDIDQDDGGDMPESVHGRRGGETKLDSGHG